MLKMCDTCYGNGITETITDNGTSRWNTCEDCDGRNVIDIPMPACDCCGYETNDLLYLPERGEICRDCANPINPMIVIS